MKFSVDETMAEPNPYVRFGLYFSLIFEFGGAIVAGVVLGSLADRYLGTAPTGGLLIIVASVVLAFVRLVDTLRRLDRSQPHDGHRKDP